MSEERIKIGELVEELAARTGMEKNQAERMLKSLFAQIEQGLKTDGSVKINKFGTFKLQPIEARKSVDVTTGKEIMLDPYNKVTFTPDNEVKQRINEPFAFLEPVVMENMDSAETTDTESDVAASPTEEAIGQNLQKLDEQADEIKALLFDINGENWFLGSNSETEEDTDEQDETDGDDEDVSVEWENTVEVVAESQSLEQTARIEETQEEEAQSEQLQEEPVVSLEMQESEKETESLPESVETEESIQEIQKEEIKETLIEEEVPAITTEETALSADKPQEQDKSENVQEQETVRQEEKPEPVVLQSEWKAEDSKAQEKTVTALTVPTVENPANPKSTTKRKKRSGIKLWKVGAIIAVAFCLILVGVYFYMVYRVETWANGKLEQARPETEWIESLENESVMEEENVITSSEPTAKEESVSNKQTASETLSVFEQPRNYDKLIATEQLTEGSRLAWLAKKYYGDARFWVYIYEANRDHISNPNSITIGTTIKVPELPKELIDANNPACIDYAKRLHEQFIK